MHEYGRQRIHSIHPVTTMTFRRITYRTERSVALLLLLASLACGDSVTWTNPCLSEPLSKTDVCDTTKSNEDRIETLVGLLQPLEKAVLMSNTALAVHV